MKLKISYFIFLGKNEDSGLDDSTELPISKDAVIEFKTSEEKISNVASSKGMHFFNITDAIPIDLRILKVTVIFALLSNLKYILSSYPSLL